MSDRFIKVYDDALPLYLCDKACAQFRAALEINDPTIGQRNIVNDSGALIRNETVVTNNPAWTWLQEALLAQAGVYLRRYVRDCEIDTKRMWPAKYGFESFTIKHYREGEGRFDEHVDVADYASARRFLIFFWYLNTVEDGGETDMSPSVGYEYLVKPVAGRLVMMPPLWTHLHAGRPTRKGDKLIAGGYLHYV